MTNENNFSPTSLRQPFKYLKIAIFPKLHTGRLGLDTTPFPTFLQGQFRTRLHPLSSCKTGSRPGCPPCSWIEPCHTHSGHCIWPASPIWCMADHATPIWPASQKGSAPLRYAVQLVNLCSSVQTILFSSTLTHLASIKLSSSDIKYLEILLLLKHVVKI